MSRPQRWTLWFLHCHTRLASRHIVRVQIFRSPWQMLVHLQVQKWLSGARPMKGVFCASGWPYFWANHMCHSTLSVQKRLWGRTHSRSLTDGWNAFLPNFLTLKSCCPVRDYMKAQHSSGHTLLKIKVLKRFFTAMPKKNPFWIHKEPFNQKFFKEPSLSYLFIIQSTFFRHK